jgi:hypothetical protein
MPLAAILRLLSFFTEPLLISRIHSHNQPRTQAYANKHNSGNRTKITP